MSCLAGKNWSLGGFSVETVSLKKILANCSGCSGNTIYSVGRGILTSTGCIAVWWKEQFGELLIPVGTPSTEELEPGDSEVSAITQAFWIGLCNIVWQCQRPEGMFQL